MTSDIAVIINPAAGGGRGAVVWNTLKAKLNGRYDSVSTYFSTKEEPIRQLSARVIAKEPDLLLIIGGDGTINQVINGLIDSDKLCSPLTKLAIFNAGCGGDFLRQFSKTQGDDLLEKLASHSAQKVDVGKIEYGKHDCHYFINIASFGLSAKVAKQSSDSRFFKRLGGSINYFIHALIGLMRHRNKKVLLSLNDKYRQECNLTFAAICNGQYFGGGMHIAPQAKVDDILFDVIVFKDFNFLSVIFKLPLVYFGKHVKLKNVEQYQARSIELFPKNNDYEVMIEADGECLGNLPAKVTLLDFQLDIVF